MARLFMTRKQLEERVKQGGLMTSFKWRLKLLKEHGLYLDRRPWGSGDFRVRKFSGKWNDNFVQTHKNGEKYISYTEIIKSGAILEHVVNYNAWKCYCEETIKEVLLKVQRTDRRVVMGEQNETLKAIDQL